MAWPFCNELATGMLIAFEESDMAMVEPGASLSVAFAVAVMVVPNSVRTLTVKTRFPRAAERSTHTLARNVPSGARRAVPNTF